MKFLLTAFSERNGKASSRRILTFLVVVDLLVCYTAVVFRRWEMPPMSMEMATIILGALGISAWGRGREHEQKEQKETKETKL